jgi:hypothetical protein
MDNPLKGTHPRFDDHPRWPNIERAIQDLPKMPKYNKQRQWMYAIGADFGYHPDPFALVVWAFSNDTNDVYELIQLEGDEGPHRRPGPLHADGVAGSTTSWCSSAIRPASRTTSRSGARAWACRSTRRTRSGKNTLEEFLADDIRRGRIHLRHDSPLYDEMKHLLYLPTKPGKTREAAKHRRSGDGVVHGDHCCDAARYSYEALTHYLS